VESVFCGVFYRRQLGVGFFESKFLRCPCDVGVVMSLADVVKCVMVSPAKQDLAERGSFLV